MDNILLAELIKLSNDIHATQQYLVLQANNPKANYEGGATPAVAVEMIGKRLDKLIANYVVNSNSQQFPALVFGSRILGSIKYEVARRRTLMEWGTTVQVI